MYNNASVNKVFLMGYVAREPRIHNSKNGKPQLSFSLTTTESIKTQGGDIQHSEVHAIKINADAACLKDVNLKKGDMLYVQGRLQTHAFVDEQLIKRYKTEIVAIGVELFDPIQL
ncbi:MAG: single-stranded DNA-binding protein [Sphingobacteriaceae bacterium]|nr:MAG: single-stranded DNA-binding protein [Sphingobacteriaceae bacterium]